MPLLRYTFGPEFKAKAEKIAERFATLHEHRGQQLLYESVNRSCDTIIELARIYPPEKANSPWKRGEGRWNPKTRVVYDAPYAKSQDMKNSWTKTVRSTPNAAVGVIQNTAGYSSYVMSRRGQAWMHKGVWNTVEDITDAVLGLIDTGALGINIGRVIEPELEKLPRLMREHIEGSL